jgi:hypothetical protein
VGAPRCIAIAIASGLLSLAGCDAGGPIEISVLPDGDGGGTSGVDAGTGDGSSQEDADAAAGDAGVSPVLVAITPTPAGSAPTPGEALSAELTTFGAGARAAVLALPWDAIAEGEDPALAQKTAFYEAHGKRVALEVAVVDRLVDHRPAAIAGEAWSAPAAVAAMEKTVDALFASSGPEVRYLTLGRDVDVYLEAHPDERPAFVAFVKQVFAYAHDHEDAPPDLEVGVAFSHAAPKAEPAFGNLRDLGDVVAFSYFPGLSTFAPAEEPGAALVVTQLVEAVGSKPIVLSATGHASDAAAGGSEDAQQAFFATLFGAIGAQRKSFALVGVVELFDAAPSSCAAWAVAQGGEVGGPLASYACSLGVIRADGAPKPAWQAVLTGSAALSSP